MMGGASWYDQPLYSPSYNIPPTQFQPVLLHKDAARDIELIAANKTKTEMTVNENYDYIERKIVNPGENKMTECLDSMAVLGKFLKIKSMKWGLLPSWSAHKKSKPIIPINIRDDSLMANAKPMFNRLKNSNRCCVLAQGFFEWKTSGKGKNAQKIPYFTHLPDNSEQPLMLLGALYDQIKLNGQTSFSYAIVTTQANEAFSSIHERMPLIFDPVIDQDKILKWLSPRVPFNDTIKQMLVPYEDALVTYEVPLGVNNVSHDESYFIQPVFERKAALEDSEKKSKLTLDSFFTSSKRERDEDRSDPKDPKNQTKVYKERGLNYFSRKENQNIKSDSPLQKNCVKIEPECISLDSD
ncbi:hypothetical protein DSO57_1017573 [Entomophthora muscae]|nr:hypothetical protein DSO57_1017573 [Entomophthora muscae]